MKILLSIIISGTMSLAFAQEGPAEKAKDAVENTAKSVKKAVKEVTSEATHRVNVTMTEYHFEMPSTTRPGLTTFVIKNAGKKGTHL